MLVHSYVGVVTNSSTQIYSMVENIQIIKDFINEILKDVGSDKTADELYNFEIKVSDNDLAEYYYEDYLESLATKEQQDAFVRLPYLESIQEIQANVDNKVLLKYYTEHKELYDSHLEITTKDGQKRISNFQDIYNLEESYE